MTSLTRSHNVRLRVAVSRLLTWASCSSFARSARTQPEYLRKGIASRLMEAAEAGLASKGCPKVNLQVRASNTRVVDFYKAAGYSMEDRISMASASQPPACHYLAGN